jgi:MoaA/NifB/PqqE/SkfB family radical SAM enzyme|tara:strand:+ start:134 stop:1048 length:915 start_codon:yes stop_codon:yes gene_type:complete
MDKITYAYLETTNYCNLDCSFCNRTDVIGPLKHMSLEDWGKLLDGIKHHPIEEAKLMGMGEPMLHPQFDEVCRMFKETFPKCKVIVATNCQYNINDKFRESLKYIDMLYLSIDGYEENYERDRAPAKWKKLIRFLDQFESVDRHDCDVVVNYVVNAYNVYDIPKIDELRVNYDLGELRLNIAQIWDADTKMSDDVATSGYTKHQLDYLKKNYGGKIMGKSKWDFKDCFWVNNAIYTTVEGNVKMCCMNTGAEPFGNLFENSIDEIREMVDYQNVKRGCETNNPTSHCKNCSYKELTPILEYVGV